MNIKKKYMNVIECAEYLGLQPCTIYKYVSLRIIPHYKIGRRLLFDVEEIDTWVHKGMIVTIPEYLNNRRAS